jgi:peptidoglycan/LPS O-acetylase OafA/YrhL
MSHAELRLQREGRADVSADPRPQQLPSRNGSGGARLNWLDGLRAYAVTGVVLVHTANVEQAPLGSLPYLGQYGVQLFFVISAITIFMTLSSTLRRGRSLRGWYVRRFFRVAPLYYLAAVVYLIDRAIQFKLGHAGDPEAFRIGNYVANLLFIHAFVPTAINNIVPGGWSIGVEMAFYLVAPILLVGMRPARWAFPILAALSVLSLALTWWLTSGSVANNSFFYFWPATEFPVFFVGLMLCAQAPWLLTLQPTPLAWTIGAAVVVLLAAIVGSGCGVLGGYNHMLAPLAFGVAFSALAVLARGPLRFAVENGVAQVIGRLSYSIYIVHFAVLDCWKIARKFDVASGLPQAVHFLFLLGFTIFAATALALVTKRFIEDPCIRIGHDLAKKLDARRPKMRAYSG